MVAHVKMGRGWVGGHLQVYRQGGMTVLCMCEGFSHPNERADDHDIIL